MQTNQEPANTEPEIKESSNQEVTNQESLIKANIQLGVVGNPIAHSLSPPIHHAFAASLNLPVNYQKILAPLLAENADGFRKTITEFFSNNGTGLNVTVPFKEEAFRLCDVLSERAKMAGAVNTLYMQNRQLIGDNTDGIGLVNAITNLAKQNHAKANHWQLSNANIAILGAGGACRGVLLPLINAGVRKVTIANRTLAKAQVLINDMVTAKPAVAEKLACVPLEGLTGDYDIIINATSSGLHNQSLTLNEKLTCHCAYDMVYKKDQTLTPFMTHFKQKNALVADGFGMLVGQAAVSFEIWTGQKPVYSLANMQSIFGIEQK